MSTLLFTCGVIMAVTPATAYAYIDPQTTTTVVSGLGAIIAAVVAGWMFVWLACKRVASSLWALIKKTWRIQAISLVLLIICALLIDIPTFHAKHSPAAGSDKRAILLGFDGLDPVLLERYMGEGLLPSFSRLRDLGDFKAMATVSPVQSPVVWTTMATGLSPAVHEITDFIKRKDQSYVPTLALTKPANGLVDALVGNSFDAPVSPKLFLWERLHEAGVKVSVMRWPMTFPPEGNVTMLSGLGTPDLQGNMGSYTLVTEDAEAYNDDLKGRVIALSVDEGGRGAVALPGPQMSGLGGAAESAGSLRFKIDRQEAKVWLQTDEREVVLKENELSPWLSTTFAGNSMLSGSVSGIFRVMVLQVRPSVSLYVTPIQIDPRDPLHRVSEPAGLARELAERSGLFHTLGMSEDTNALVDEVIDEEQFIAMAETIMDDAEKLFLDQLSRNPTGFVSFVFDTVDRVCHVFWRHIDPAHPNHDASKAKRYAKVIETFYKRADRIVGRVLQQIDLSRDSLFIVSDHGFASYRRNFHLNAWLIDNGYMKVRPSDDGGTGPLFEHVDWKATKAFALGFSQIFFNVEGREEEGIVKPAEVELLKHELQQKLLATNDDLEGTKPVEAVHDAVTAYGVGLPYGPELVVGLKKGYRFSWQTAMGAAPGYQFEDNLKAWSGDHIIEPRHVPGIILSNRKIESASPSVYDIAPTILSLFEVEADERMQGSALASNPSS